MQLFSRTHRALGLALLAACVSFQSANGQGKSDAVHFDTADGVKIEGTYWASDKGKKAPVVLMLHDFNYKTGGSSHDDGWDSLAAALNKDGFAVLQFDFRGFGKSTSIDSAKFWMYPHNNRQIRGFSLAKPPESISHGDFLNVYYTVLANDVAAARAYLDRKNDAGELNTANLIVIGAGEGATVGALWLASDLHRYRGTPLIMAVGPITDPRLVRFDSSSEGKDVRAAIWIDIADTIGGRRVPSARGWVIEASKLNKVPTAFIYGKDNAASNQQALTYMRSLVPGYSRTGKATKDNPLPLTGDKGIDGTKLTGSKLLFKSLETEKWILSYLDAPHMFVQQKAEDELPMKKNLKEEWRDRDSGKSKQYWRFSTPPLVPAKNENDLVPQLIPLTRFGV